MILCLNRSHPLDQKGQLMEFQEAIKSGFKNWRNFSDRASRSEYWYWTLFAMILGALITIICSTILDMEDIGDCLWLAITLIPSLSVAVRRLHDINKSGWWILLNLLPLIGYIILFIWHCKKGTDGPNNYGSDPLAQQILIEN